MYPELLINLNANAFNNVNLNLIIGNNLFNYLAQTFKDDSEGRNNFLNNFFEVINLNYNENYNFNDYLKLTNEKIAEIAQNKESKINNKKTEIIAENIENPLLSSEEKEETTNQMSLNSAIQIDLTVLSSGKNKEGYTMTDKTSDELNKEDLHNKTSEKCIINLEVQEC